MKLFLTLGTLAGCALCSEQTQTDGAILYMLGGEAIPPPPCLTDQDSDAILFIYGGSKAHQFKAVTANEAGDDETIAYIFGGNPPVHDDEEAEVTAFLYGGDHDTTTQFSSPINVDADLANFILGTSTQQVAMHAPPAGTAFLNDDVALIEHNDVLEKLTEWLPSQSYAKAEWMLASTDITDDQLALYMLSGSMPEIDHVHEISDVLFGGIFTDAPLVSVQVPSDVDLVMKHRNAVERQGQGRVLDMVELVELAEAADSELAAYMLGGDEREDAEDTTESDIAKYLFGSHDPLQAEKSLADLVDEFDSTTAVDMVSLVDRHDNNDALYYLGGDAAISTVPQHNYSEDLVTLVDRVDAVDTELALFLQGSSAPIKGVAGPSSMEEEVATTITFLYDSHSTGTAATAAIREFYGDTQLTVDHEAEAVKFLYGASESQPKMPIFSKNSYVTGDDELIAQMLGGDVAAWSEDDDTILFVLGDSASVTPEVAASDSFAPVETQPLAPRPYTGDESEDCSDHECISRTLQSMQVELGLSEVDFKGGMIWGEDMVEFCQWQMGEKPVVDVMRMPALPSSYSILRPPSHATCKQVLKPALQIPMVKSG